MSDSQQGLIRVTLLTTLRGASREFGLAIGAIANGLRLRGLEVDENEAHKELIYLQDKGLVMMERDALDRQVLRYRITANGLDHLDERGA